MTKNILQSIYNVQVWPMFALVMFMTFFVAVLWFALSRKASYVDGLRALPLDDDNPSEENRHE